ncbi:TonB-dependent receptor [Paenalcaligenes niemegkensis]|uniref:TonB-dependent receptor n=1 Tax=Paenalcaligenes niemegkensis TaxID=2895469 RepID=UPI001EE8EF7A|nr:TonB-dependent receptor [Paenalcaligenes niemegkensis]MCQ9617514.1 TonB-dependent receptor [Paenalcaligenes niemegkensis]
MSYSPQKRRTDATKYQRSAAGVGTTTQDILQWEEDFYQYDLQLSSSAKFLGADHLLTYGFQGDTTKANYLRTTSSLNHSTGQQSFSEASGFANSTTHRNDLYIQDEMTWGDGRFMLTPGVRWANYKIKPSVRDSYDPVPGKEPRNLSSHRFIPQLGALLRLDDKHSVYARYAEGFKMPTAQQLYSSNVYPTMVISPNPDLQPEKVRSYEIGFRGQHDNMAQFDSANYSIGLFKADYKNFIQNFYNIPGTNHYTYQNLSQLTIWGVEAFGELAFNHNWSLMGSLAWQHGDQRASSEAKKQAYAHIPPLTAVAGVKWRKPELGLETELIGTFAKGPSRVHNKSEVFTPGGYSILDAFVNWSPPNLRKGDGQYVTFSFAINNLLDKRYFSWPMFTTYATSASPAVAGQNPIELQTSPGRVFKLGATLRF